MQIYGPSQLHGAQGVSAPHINQRAGSTQSTSRTADTRDSLEISSEGMFAAQIDSLPDVRMDRVNAIRAQIANGTYETDDKLNAALENMLDELA